MPRPFLTAEWRYLAMLNYAIDPAVVKPFVPAGTELDFFDGTAYVSMVGFLFLNTRVWGIPIPWHMNFEEVNLRMYVRRYHPEDGWRRGVVFIREIVPRAAIAWTARQTYGERYVAMPMKHQLGPVSRPGEAPAVVEYCWKSDRWNSLSVKPHGPAAIPAAGSVEEFITEHYWGYVSSRGKGSLEYRVAHPQWPVWQAAEANFDCDVKGIYGPQFSEALAAAPASAFLAEGSATEVYPGVSL